MTKLIYQHFAEGRIAVGISGDNKEEVLHQYYSFYNLKGTDKGLIWVNGNHPPFFCYFWTNYLKLDHWLVESSKRIYANKTKQIKSTRAAIQEIKALTEKRRAEITPEIFMRSSTYHDAFKVHAAC